MRLRSKVVEGGGALLARVPLLLYFGVTLTSGAGAQRPAPGGSAPWVVTLTPTLSPLPIGFCGAVNLSVLDARGQGARNPAGYLLGFADFDISVTAPDPQAVAGQPIGTSGWSVCGCRAGKPGTVATITASYPAAGLAAKLRAPGVAFQTTTTVTLAAAKGNVDPPICAAPRPVTVAALPAPMPAAPAGRIAPGAPPTGVTVSGTPLIANVTWTAAPNAVRYAVLRKDDAQPAVERSPPALTATAFTETLPDPRITYQYIVVAYYADGSQGSAPAVQYISPPMVNPTGFTATKRGQTSPLRATVDFAWDAVPGAVQYRLDGPGIVSTGHYVTTTSATLDVPRGANAWTVAAVYPGNYGDYTKPASVSAVIRILPTPSQRWLTRNNGPGSQGEVQTPAPVCSAVAINCFPNRLQHPYDPTYATWLGREAGGLGPSAWWPGLNAWLWPADVSALKVWDDIRQYDVEARYGNPGDLGVGRRSDCMQQVSSGPRPGMYTVCYAAAHGIPPGRPGFNDPQVITRPGEGQGDDFILAMVITKDPQGSVFMVFGKGGKYQLSPTVTLDTQGPKFVPHACLSCHGGTYNTVTHYVDGASLLPIDPNLQSFANGAEKDGQQETIRRINAMIALSGSSPAITAYINGLYANAVHLLGRQATVDYVPAGWQSQADLYRKVVRPYCAMCHLAVSSSSNLSFASSGNFQSNAGRIKVAVCGLYTMPHAEIQFTEFWTKDTGPVYLPGLMAAALGYPSC